MDPLEDRATLPDQGLRRSGPKGLRPAAGVDKMFDIRVLAFQFYNAYSNGGSPAAARAAACIFLALNF